MPHEHSDKCYAADLGEPFLDRMEALVKKLRKSKHTTQGERDGGGLMCEMPKTVGPLVWAVMHGAAESMRDDVCPNCGKHAVKFINGLHDAVNSHLDKPIRDPYALATLFQAAQKAIDKEIAAGGDRAFFMESAMSDKRRSQVADPGLKIIARNLPFEPGRESVYVMYLDKPDGRMIETKEVAIGELRSAPVPMARIMQEAHSLGAKAAVLVHNHPSGNPMPSDEDVSVTAQAETEARQHGFKLQDHLIVAGQTVRSVKG